MIRSAPGLSAAYLRDFRRRPLAFALNHHRASARRFYLMLLSELTNLSLRLRSTYTLTLLINCA